MARARSPSRWSATSSPARPSRPWRSTLSGWHRRGEATLSVVSGDGEGLTQTECWDATLRGDLQRQALVGGRGLRGRLPSARLFRVFRKNSNSYVGLDPRCDVVVPWTSPTAEEGRSWQSISGESIPGTNVSSRSRSCPKGRSRPPRPVTFRSGGLYLDSLTSLPIGTTVQLRFTLPTQPEPVEVAGDVRWVVKKGTSDASGIGIRFQGLRARDVWALNRFFQSVPT